MKALRIWVGVWLFAAAHAAAYAQTTASPIAANVGGPVTLKKSESVNACLTNMSDSPVAMVVQVLTIGEDGTTPPVPAPQGRLETSFRPGQTVCQSFKVADFPAANKFADGSARVILVTHGVDTNGQTWATIGPNLLSAYEVVSAKGKVRLLVPNGQKVIQSNLLQ